MFRTGKLLSTLIKGAELLGLPASDIEAACEFLEYNEYELCFEQIVTQLYEYDTGITQQYYSLVAEIGLKLKLQQGQFDFLRELTRDTLPQSQEKLNSLAKLLK